MKQIVSSKTKGSINNTILNIILFIFALSYSTQSQAQYNYIEASDTVVSTIKRSIPQEKIDEYRSTPAYNYEQNPTYEDNTLQRLWLSFLKWLERVLGRGGYSLLGDLIYYGLMVVAAVGLIFIILRAQGHNPFSRSERKTQTELEADTIDENSSVESINNLILKAESAGEYRLAIRLQFLKTLRLLDDKKHILWRSGKTNHEYLNEINDAEIKEKFDDITYVFEYSWYGQFEVESESQYHQLREGFISLFNQLRG